MASIPNTVLSRPSLPEGASLFLAFVYLQALDVLTTFAFLLGGVREANPIVRAAISATASPWGGLVLVKVVALMLGLYCWLGGRTRLLRRVNVLFALLVAYNLCCLILGLSARLDG